MQRRWGGVWPRLLDASALLCLQSTVAAPETRATELYVMRSSWELIVPVGVSGLFAALVASGRPPSCLPAALISVAGVVGLATTVALLLVVLAGGLDGRITHWRVILAPGGVTLLLAFGVQAGAAAVRWTLLDGVLGGSL